MLAEIFLVALVLAVALLVTGDVARTNSESLYGHADGPDYDTEPKIIGAPRGSGAEELPREPAGAGIPAVHDADPTRRPENITPSAGGHQPPRTVPPPVHGRSRRELKDWPVRSRLLLLISIPAVAVTAVAFCVVRLVDTLQGAPIHSQSSSVGDRAILAALAIIVLALASWFTTVVVRSVLQPLYKLRAGALEIAGVGLPDAVRRINESNGESLPSDVEPIDVDSSDEIGEVARAFDQIRRETLRLAVNEAALRGNLNAMFVNLSHRSQSVMERQIRLIENLKQGEHDAERLANLVKIDHIATRMHRNSQNLLVLAGHRPSGSWNQPVALVNVIRAAVSEIEDYERVSLNAQPDIAVRGPAVNDLVHLLAELAENATSFSAADMSVDISGQLLTRGGALVHITDRGVGMGAKEMEYANWRLENPPVADVNVSKWMGLFVVGRLAARHGIRVRLNPAEFGGLTALVWLPDEVITHQGPAAPPRFSGFSSAKSRPDSYETAMDSDYATAGQRATTVRPTDFPPPREDAPIGRRRRISVADQGLGPTSSGNGPQPVSQAESPWAVRPSGAGPSDATGEDAGHQAPDLGDEAAVRIAGETSGMDSLSGPGLSAPGESKMSQFSSASLGTAAPLSQETTSADGGVIVSSAEGPAGTRRLPIFDAVESGWFRGGRLTLGSSGITSAAGSRWSSPADEAWHAAETVDSPSSGGSTAAGLPQRLPNANLVPGAVPGTQPVVPNRSPAAARDRLAGLQRGVSDGRAVASEAANPGEEDES
jgi:signal transduction histidine kinase